MHLGCGARCVGFCVAKELQSSRDYWFRVRYACKLTDADSEFTPAVSARTMPEPATPPMTAFVSVTESARAHRYYSG